MSADEPGQPQDDSPDGGQALPRVARVKGMQWVSPVGATRMGLGKDDLEDDDTAPPDTSAYRRPSARPDPGATLSPRGRGASSRSSLDAALAVPVTSVRTGTVRRAPPKVPTAPPAGPPPPEPLPRVSVMSSPGPDQKCPVCGGALRVLRTRRESRLDARWFSFEWLDIDRGLADCPKCPSVPTRRLAEPAYTLPGAPVGNGLLAWVLTWRWQDWMPGPELARALRVLGVKATDTDTSRWLAAAADALAPVFAAVRAEAEGGAVDEKGIPVIDGRTEGRMRATVGRRAVAFSFTAEELGPAGSAPNERSHALFLEMRSWSRAGRQALLRRRAAHALARDPRGAARVAWRLEELRRARTADAEAGALERVREAMASAPARNHSPHLRELDLLLEQGADDLLRHGPDGPRPPLPLPENARFSLPAWYISGGDGDADTVGGWLSVVTSCALVGLPPWAFLRDALDAACRGQLDKPERWTPSARAGA